MAAFDRKFPSMGTLCGWSMPLLFPVGDSGKCPFVPEFSLQYVGPSDEYCKKETLICTFMIKKRMAAAARLA